MGRNLVRSMKKSSIRERIRRHNEYGSLLTNTMTTSVVASSNQEDSSGTANSNSSVHPSPLEQNNHLINVDMKLQYRGKEIVFHNQQPQDIEPLLSKYNSNQSMYDEQQQENEEDDIAFFSSSWFDDDSSSDDSSFDDTADIHCCDDNSKRNRKKNQLMDGTPMNHEEDQQLVSHKKHHYKKKTIHSKKEARRAALRNRRDLYFLNEYLLAVVFSSILMFVSYLSKPDSIYLQNRVIYTAEIFFEEKCYQNATTFLRRSTDILGTTYSHWYLAKSLLKSNLPKDALKHFKIANSLEKNPKIKIPILIAIGKLYNQFQKHVQAVDTYKSIINIASEDSTSVIPTVYFNVALSLIRLKRIEEALLYYDLAIALLKNEMLVAKAHFQKGRCFLSNGSINNAIDSFKSAFVLQPLNFAYASSLAYAYLENKDHLNSGIYFTYAKDLSPVKSAEKYMKAALYGRNYSPKRAPSSFLKSIFDVLAFRYHKVINMGETKGNSRNSAGESIHEFRQLHGLIFQNTSSIIASRLKRYMGVTKGERWLDVVDLGCGSGESAFSYRDLANHVTGIEVSPIAIENARLLVGVYDKLVVGEISQVVRRLPSATYDLAIASNSLPYIGSLDNVFIEVGRILRPEGVFAFSVDLLEQYNTSNVESYSLDFTGRWSHSNDYIIEMIKKHNFSVLHNEIITDYQSYTQFSNYSIIGSLDKQPKLANLFLLKKM